MRRTATASSVLLAAAACVSPAAANVGRLPDWSPVATPSWSPAGLMDSADAVVDGRTVTAWFRFVDTPGRPDAETDPDVRDVLRDGGSIDVRMTIDCSAPRFRVVGTRIVGPDGATRSQGAVPADRVVWAAARKGTMGAAVRASVCARSR